MSTQTLKREAGLYYRRMRHGRPSAKVFCVGLQKTGTTSLQYALHSVGYRVAGMFDINDFVDASRTTRKAIEIARKHDAAGDHPWPILYRELDEAFPESKFILTLRNPEKWYASVCRHFGTAETPMRRWIYGAGSPVGNKEVYVSRLKGHIAEVREYFSNRPDDLLEIDVTAGDGWDKVGPFIGKAIGDRPFPRLNVGATNISNERGSCL